MKFDFVYLGQTVLKYEVPVEVFVGLNDVYEKRKKELLLHKPIIKIIFQKL